MVKCCCFFFEVFSNYEYKVNPLTNLEIIKSDIVVLSVLKRFIHHELISLVTIAFQARWKTRRTIRNGPGRFHTQCTGVVFEYQLANYYCEQLPYNTRKIRSQITSSSREEMNEFKFFFVNEL